MSGDGARRPPPVRAGARASADGARDPIDAALEAVPSPAFLVREVREIVRANARGAALLAAEPAEVARALASDDSPATRRIAVAGAPEHALVILAERPGDARTRAAAAARRWDLTERQRDVLALLATGSSNGAIARALRCSEKTVEAHVSAILAKAGGTNRAEVIALFWSRDP